MVYADAEGAGGLQMAGWIPDRTLSPQLLPLPGRARWYDWNSPVPFEALPSARLDARRGWVVAADDRLRSPDEEVSIEWLWRSGERAARIERLLTETVGAGPVDLRRATEIQTDVGNARALDLVRSALSLGVASDGVGFSPEAQELTEILARWDGSTHADSVGASAYHVFLRSLTEALLEERLGEPLMRRYLALPQTDPERLVYEIVRHSARGGRGVPEQERERVVRAVRESLREGWLQLSFELGANRRRWSWGRLHSLRFRSFGGLDAVLGDLEDLGPYPYGGDASTVNAGAYDPSRPFGARGLHAAARGRHGLTGPDPGCPCSRPVGAPGAPEPWRRDLRLAEGAIEPRRERSSAGRGFERGSAAPGAGTLTPGACPGHCCSQRCPGSTRRSNGPRIRPCPIAP
jgi:acyl-homoserine lactone acylase PvdQ